MVPVNRILTALSPLHDVGARAGDSIELDTPDGAVRIALDDGRAERIARERSTSASTFALQRDVLCPARGLRVVVEVTRERQRLVVHAIATSGDPETLPAITASRVLVEAENAVRADQQLGHLAVTASCEHVVFEHGTEVYLAAIESGRVAHVAQGLISRR